MLSLGPGLQVDQWALETPLMLSAITSLNAVSEAEWDRPYSWSRNACSIRFAIAQSLFFLASYSSEDDVTALNGSKTVCRMAFIVQRQSAYAPNSLGGPSSSSSLDVIPDSSLRNLSYRKCCGCSTNRFEPGQFMPRLGPTGHSLVRVFSTDSEVPQMLGPRTDGR